MSKAPEKDATPFLKWAGGKRAAVPTILPRLPKKFGEYFEPMVGGGAVFFELKSKKIIKSAFISDLNEELIITYLQVKNNPTKLISLLEKHAKQHAASSPWQDTVDANGQLKQVKDGKGYYYRARNQSPTTKLRKAARMIYLNRTCFNGLYRVNSDGKFNVPAGHYNNPDIIQEARIKSCAKALKNTSILYQGYDKINPQKGDFVYLDPPYDVWNETSFTKYNSGDFAWEDQVKLAEFAVKLRDENGAHVMISNHATPRILKLYKKMGFYVHCFLVGRPVASQAKNRKAVYEVLATTYPVSKYRDPKTKNKAKP